VRYSAQVCHDLVPVVCVQLGGDRRRVRTALLAGSLLPLAMFVSWDAIMLALTSEPGGCSCA
jgi:tyrosine-specific transport protein